MNAKHPTTATETTDRTDEQRDEVPRVVVLPHAAMPVSQEVAKDHGAPSLEDERGVVCEPMS